ncbi:hypothetical protein CLV35_2810 [Motilibacter peucedani]|uniref:DUF7847 domain-containing protein n=1 Tax=Motilibacter peucedani TaxID=598650 RepID=A0A420XMR0_9ACTN|nr:hypothetical protein [Motilibacter peucedani]RKS72563.1 hypothetical protein CLV35_2810 [Motilibacter peucedani]
MSDDETRWASPGAAPPPPPGQYGQQGPPPGQYGQQGPPPGQPGQQGPPPGQYGPPPGQYAGPPPGWGPSPYGPAPYGSAPVPYADVKPGVIPLRPLSVMEILDGSVSTARRHPRVTLGLTAAVVAVSTLVSVVLGVLLLSDSSSVLNETEVTDAQWRHLAADFIPWVAVTAVLTVAGQVVLTGVLTAVMGRAVLGRPVRLAEIWSEVRPRLLTLLGLTLSAVVVLVVAAGLVVGLAALVAVATVPAAGVLLGLLLALALVPVAIWLATMVGVAGPAVVLERQGVRGGFRRSFRLVRGSFWRVLGVLALVQVVTQVAGGIISVPFVAGSAVLAAATDSTSFSLLPQVLTGIGQVASGVVTYPIAAGATALLYVDLRMRREGLDLELARAASAPQR